VKVKLIAINTPPEDRTSGPGFRIKEDAERITEPVDLDLLARQVHQRARKEDRVVGFGYGGGPVNSKRILWRHVAFAISVPDSELVAIRHGWFAGDKQHDVKWAAKLLYTERWASSIRDLWDGRVKRVARHKASRVALRRAWESDCDVIERLAAVVDGQ